MAAVDKTKAAGTGVGNKGINNWNPQRVKEREMPENVDYRQNTNRLTFYFRKFSMYTCD